MVEVIKDLKDQLLEQMDKEVSERGAERLDPDMVDMVKDLAEAEKSCWEAEYYRAVTEAMEGGSGYSSGYSGGSGGSSGYGYRRGYEGGSQGSQGSQGYGYGYGNRSGWANQYGRGYSRRGYDSMGHTDSIEGIRNIMMTANQEEKERMKAELRSMLDM